MIDSIVKSLENMFTETVSLRRYFHQFPELSFEEENTPKKIAEYLNSLGIKVRTDVGGRGVVGVIEGKYPGKTVALRADFDALAIQDQKEVEYKSKVPGKMHACGHDGHTAALLSVAKVLQEHRDHIKGKVVLIHQFAEEITPGGAISMIEDGCLDGVDAIFGTHLWSTIPVGKIGFHSGPIMAAADKFTVEIQGEGGHGGQPHRTCDPIILATNYIQMLQQIVSRNIDPLSSAVISVCTIHSGSSFNVIPEKVQLSGTVRTFDVEVQEIVFNRMETLLKTLCEGAGASYTFEFEKGYPPVINHQEETQFAMKCAQQLLGEEKVFDYQPQMAGEDFSYYLQKVPGTFFFTGAGNPEIGAKYPHHHPKFDIDEKALLYAAQVLAIVAVQYLEKHEGKIK
ncbi:amidohydrolase [Oikeobacillus pervagus]|uniref:Amidohydrolase n=1 Tax=Oikeobacillus pervagus TaxID=1325931 RepID=A0AAJ1T579_9BACI|nr:amidohydrolase [Oikeobacillus pervagus]MDQ0216836.1 amidohydrolase [Oikeobacillus pervagus]